MDKDIVQMYKNSLNVVKHITEEEFFNNGKGYEKLSIEASALLNKKLISKETFAIKADEIMVRTWAEYSNQNYQGFVGLFSKLNFSIGNKLKMAEDEYNQLNKQVKQHKLVREVLLQETAYSGLTSKLEGCEENLELYNSRQDSYER